MYVCMYVSIYVCMYVCLCVRACVCVCVSVCRCVSFACICVFLLSHTAIHKEWFRASHSRGHHPFMIIMRRFLFPPMGPFHSR